MGWRKRIGIFGNCQADAIAAILTDHEQFIAQFELVPIKPIYLMTPGERESLRARMADFDVFVCQQLNTEYAPADTQSLFSSMRPGTTAISIPVMWFDAYFPDMFYLKGVDGSNVRGAPCAYHSRTIVDCYKAGLTVNDAAERLSEQADESAVLSNLRDNFDRLRGRETRLDVTIAEEVQESFRLRPLFRTINHPTAYLLYIVIDKLLMLLGMSKLPDSVKEKHDDILTDINWRISPSVARILGLTYLQNSDFFIGRTRYERQEFASLYYTFYRKSGVLGTGQVVQTT